MSQWGNSFDYKGYTFVPHIKTEVFEQIEGHNIVDGIICINAPHRNYQDILRRLRNQYVGKQYLILANDIFTNSTIGE